MSTEWFGTLPQHGNWREVRLKRLVSSWAQKREGEEGETYIGLENIEPWTGKILPGEDGTLTLNTGGESASIGSVFTFGDVLFSKLRPYLAKAILADRQGICSTELLVLAPGPYIDGRFLLYCLLTPGFIELVNSSAFGSKMPRAEWDFIGDIPIPLPPLHQQQQLAALLDRETARLDALVAAKQEQLELIAEKRRALITRAVTQGLDAKAPRRATGLQWLGEVPAHWEVVRLRFLAAVHTGIAKGRQVQGKNAMMVPYLRVANVQAGYLNLTEVEEIEIFAHELPGYALRPGDVLMNEGGDADKLGRGTVWEGQIDPCIHQNHVFAVRCHSVSPLWLATVSNADSSRFYFESRSKQSTNLASISSANIKEFPVVLPPIAEQGAILDYIEAESAQLDCLSQLTLQSLALLNEQRMALIAAAVTGKLELTTA